MPDKFDKTLRDPGALDNPFLSATKRGEMGLAKKDTREASNSQVSGSETLARRDHDGNIQDHSNEDRGVGRQTDIESINDSGHLAQQPDARGLGKAAKTQEGGSNRKQVNRPPQQHGSQPSRGRLGAISFWLFIFVLLACGLSWIEYTKFKDRSFSEAVGDVVVDLEVNALSAAHQSELVLVDSVALVRLGDIAEGVRAQLAMLRDYQRMDPDWFFGEGAKRFSGMETIALALLPEIDLLTNNSVLPRQVNESVVSADDLIFRLNRRLEELIQLVANSQGQTDLLISAISQRMLLEQIRSTMNRFVTVGLGWEAGIDLFEQEILQFVSTANQLATIGGAARQYGNLNQQIISLSEAVRQALILVAQQVKGDLDVQNSANRVAHNSELLAGIANAFRLDINKKKVVGGQTAYAWIYRSDVRLGLLVMIGISGLMLVWFLSRHLSVKSHTHPHTGRSTKRAIDRLVADMESLPKGDLTIWVESDDKTTEKLAESINTGIAGLRSLMEEIHATTSGVKNQGKDINHLLSQWRKDALDQVEQLVSVNGEIKRMADTVDFFYSNASESSEQMNGSIEAAQKGAETMRKSVQSMGVVRTQIQDTLGRLRRLNENSDQITEFTQSIQDAAERTNVLSLNASIQAAMAGEAGKGFAVVVEEVKRLAERSLESSNRIGDLVKNIQQDINNAVFLMETTSKEVASGVRLSDETGLALDAIKTNSQKLAGAVKHFSQDNQTDLNAVQLISQQMDAINDSSREHAQKVSQAEEMAKQLMDITERLDRSVMKFRVE